MGISVDIDPGFMIEVTYLSYLGNTNVSGDNDDNQKYTSFKSEHFFAGSQGPVMKEDFFESDEISVKKNLVASSACGGSHVFRIDTSILAYKSNKDDRDVSISINEGFSYSVTVKNCEIDA